MDKLDNFVLVGDVGLYDNNYECKNCGQRVSVSIDSAKDARLLHSCPNSVTLTIDDALAVAVSAFMGKKDKGGKPYILHCLYVMSKFSADTLQQIAVMHDIVEDTDWTLSELRHIGFDERVVTAIDILTHRPDEVYTSYILRIADSENIDAISVKMVDLEHNMLLDRLKHVSQQDRDRAKKYSQAHSLLDTKLNEIILERKLNGDKTHSL